MYPLTPFYILFCNVVHTSDLKDYSLMTAITEALLRFVDTHPPTAKLHKLFSAFLNLCSPLIQKEGQSYFPRPLSVNSTQSVPSCIAWRPQPCQANTQSGILPMQQGLPTISNFGQTQVDGSQCQSPDNLVVENLWNDELFWELFQSQPWLGWMESDIPP